MHEWLTKSYSHHQLQNAAILAVSWQRPPLLLDPYLSGVDWYAGIIHRNKKIVPVNLSSKTDITQITVIEKSVLAGAFFMLKIQIHQKFKYLEFRQFTNADGLRTADNKFNPPVNLSRKY